MDIFKSIRIRRIERARERARERAEWQMQEEQEKLEKEQKKLKEEEKEKEFQQFLKIAKKGEFLLNYCPKVYVNKIGKKLDDYDFKNMETLGNGYKEIEKVVLDTKALMIKKAKKLEAEVVVDVRSSIAYYDHASEGSSRVVYIAGTALIPKKKK